MILHEIPREAIPYPVLTENQQKALAAFYSGRRDMFEIIVKVSNTGITFWIQYHSGGRIIDFSDANVRDWAREYNRISCPLFDWSMVTVEYVSA